MYTGTLIDDLIGIVERAESSFQTELDQASSLAIFCAMIPSDLAKNNPESQLAGVA